MSGNGMQRGAIPRVLSIAGTDPTGGAGIQADLKSIAANGGYGMAVTTALVAQNTVGVRSIHLPPPTFLGEQLRAVSDDVEIDAVKIGMLPGAASIAVLADWLRAVAPPVVVLDPVMVAASGDRLLSEADERALAELLPLADLVTPNVPELGALLGEPPAASWEQLVRQAQDLSARYDVLVLAKGGHLEGPAADDALLGAADGPLTFSAVRIQRAHTHGTGCSLSAAIATRRAGGAGWEPAIREAKAWLSESIEAAGALGVGRGNGPVSHFAGLWRRGGLSHERPELIAARWWATTADVRAAIDASAFVASLADGTLGADAFAWYIAQDAVYLSEYARVLAHASALAPTSAEQGFWAAAANGAITTELALHARWLPDDGRAAPPSAVTTAYLNHLLAPAAAGAYDELVAAALPCFWIYCDVGERLLKHASPGHPYGAWLETYGDPAFRDLTDEAVRIVTGRAALAEPPTRRRMQAAFEASAAHELRFFEAPLEGRQPA